MEAINDIDDHQTFGFPIFFFPSTSKYWKKSKVGFAAVTLLFFRDKKKSGTVLCIRAITIFLKIWGPSV